MTSADERKDSIPGATRDPWLRDLEIEQAQLRGFARSFSEVEWLLLILVMLYLFVTQPALARDAVVVGILVGFAGFILLFRYTRLFSDRTARKIAFEILVMVGFLTGVLAASGTEARILSNLYLLPIVTAALALGKRATALVMLLVIVCYLLLATLESGIGALSPAFASEAAGVLAPFVLVAFLTTLLSENIHTAKARIRALSDRDELTRLYTEKTFLKLAERLHESIARAEGSYAILVVDVKQLKSINDTYGHEAGNRAMQLVADALLRLTRATDVIGRYGGDEFIVMLSNVDKEIAQEVAQRIRNVVFSTTLEIDMTIVRVQVAVGAGAFPDDGNSLQATMTAADRAMYKDKEGPERPKGRLIIERR